jgi:hypothetical protein
VSLLWIFVRLAARHPRRCSGDTYRLPRQQAYRDTYATATCNTPTASHDHATATPAATPTWPATRSGHDKPGRHALRTRLPADPGMPRSRPLAGQLPLPAALSPATLPLRWIPSRPFLPSAIYRPTVRTTVRYQSLPCGLVTYLLRVYRHLLAAAALRRASCGRLESPTLGRTKVAQRPWNTFPGLARLESISPPQALKHSIRQRHQNFRIEGSLAVAVALGSKVD